MGNDLPPGARLRCVGNQPTAQEWLRLLANLGRAERTIDAYGRGLDQYFGFCATNGIEPIHATLADVSLFVRWQRGEDDIRRAPVANSTLLQRITAIRLWYDHLVYSGLRERNPVPRSAHLRGMTSDRIRPGVGRALVRKIELLPRIPDQAGWMRIVTEAAREDLRNRLMFALAYFGALRREELVSLRVPDIDPAHRLVTVRAETSKTASGRVVSYPACAGRSLMEYMLQRRALDTAPGPLFLSVSNRNHGSPLSKWQWSKTVLGIARRADVPGFSTHSLRHLRLTHLARAGWRVHEIATYAGHRNPQTTMTYLHLSGSDLAARLAQTIQPRDQIIDDTLFWV